MKVYILLLLSMMFFELSAHSLSDIPTAPEMSITVEQVQPVSCFGSEDGAIEISISGGTSPMTYQWSNQAIVEDIYNLSPGNYNVTVTDAAGTSVSATSIMVGFPDVMSVALNFVQSVTCADADNGAIELTVYGGTAPYEYDWSHGYTEEDPTNLPTGDYQFTVTDANGCTWNSPLVTVNEPNAIVLYETITGIAPGQSTGSIEVDLNGGLPPYQFYWDNGAISQNIHNVSAGTYCLTVMDAYDCTVTQCYEIAEMTSVANEEIEGLNELKIFPNPTTEYAILSLDLETAQEVNIQIIDIVGRELMQYDAGKIANTMYRIDTEKYTKGVYFAKINVGEKAFVKKLIVK